MVTPPGSRPAALTQAQVDDLVRGTHDAAAKHLHAPRPDMAVRGDEAHESGPRPVDLTAKDVEAITRSGVAPKALLKRISEATTPEAANADTKGRRSPATQGNSAPVAEPPQFEGSGRGAE